MCLLEVINQEARTSVSLASAQRNLPLLRPRFWRLNFFQQLQEALLQFFAA